MGELQKLVNIGKVLEQQLAEVGIHTPEDLRKTGSKNAWLAILHNDPSACYNRLCGLEGAILNVRWHNLPQQTKDELKAFYRQAKSV